MKNKAGLLPLIITEVYDAQGTLEIPPSVGDWAKARFCVRNALQSS